MMPIIQALEFHISAVLVNPRKGAWNFGSTFGNSTWKKIKHTHMFLSIPFPLFAISKRKKKNRWTEGTHIEEKEHTLAGTLAARTLKEIGFLVIFAVWVESLKIVGFRPWWGMVRGLAERKDDEMKTAEAIVLLLFLLLQSVTTHFDYLPSCAHYKFRGPEYSTIFHFLRTK